MVFSKRLSLLLLLIFFNVWATFAHSAQISSAQAGSNQVILENNIQPNSLIKGSSKTSAVNATTKLLNESHLVSSMVKLGEGQMKILFWKVYNAEFFSTSAPYNAEIYPKALKLTYQRDIEKKEFIDATKDQWVKLNSHTKQRIVPEKVEDEWLEQLNDIFPNIKDEDILLLILNEKREAFFYLKHIDEEDNKTEYYQLLGQINDKNFGDYFLSIWLSKDTTEPKLRKRLIGQ